MPCGISICILRFCRVPEYIGLPRASSSAWQRYYLALAESISVLKHGELVHLLLSILISSQILTSFRSGTAWAKPSCIVKPLNVPTLQRTVGILTSRQIPFAIRSGGHLPSPLGANINNGVLIDMSMFNGVTYDATKNVAVVGAGQRWANVYNHLDPYNVTVVGGRVLDVGVAGLTLGCEFVQPCLAMMVSCSSFRRIIISLRSLRFSMRQCCQL